MALGLFLLVSWYYVTYFVIACIPAKKIEHSEKYTKFAVLVAARDESNVINLLLDCFDKMKYPREYFDLYIIIESKDDPTYEIVLNRGYKIVIRENLEGRRRKGFALDDAYQYIKKNNLEYDAFMIFDADNIVPDDYLAKMSDVYQKGYQVGVGYRNFTNSKKNWLTACSATLFAFMNQFTSRGRSVLFDKATLTGTGYFIQKEIVDREGAWIWNGMTEDVELTTYCYYHNIKMHYYPYANYYDEQADKLSVVNKQHTRWVWGFMSNKKRFKGKENVQKCDNKARRIASLIEFNFSIYPVVFIVLLLMFSAIATLILAIIAACTNYPDFGFLFVRTLFQFLIFYLIFAFASAFTIGIDNKNLKFSVGQSVMVASTYIFFIGTFGIGFLDGLFHPKKRSTWDKIDHKGELTEKGAMVAYGNKKKR